MSESNKSMLMREIPQSLAAAAAVLGSIILEPACLGQVSELLDVESFYRYEHRSIYEALLRLFQREPGESFDCVLLRDELTCGFQRGDVIVLAGRSGMGKTSLALNIVEDLLLNSNVPVGMFSLEMGCVALTERMMNSRMRLSTQKVRKANWTSETAGNWRTV